MSESRLLLEDFVAGRSSLTEIAAALARLRITHPASGAAQDDLISEMTSSGGLTAEHAGQLRAALVPPRPATDGTMLRAPSLPGRSVVPVTSATDAGLSGRSPLSSWPGRGSAETAGPIVGVGTVLRDRFVIEEVLGQGGMGVVLKARDRRREEAQDRNPHVAIKIISDDFKSHPDALIALQREARRMQQLSHPNIATVYDFDRDGEHVYLVMELLEGESLDHVIHRHLSAGLPKSEVARIVAGAGSALMHAHAKGIVHSDFKPANVFLTRSGEVKIIDFGIARIVNDATPLEDSLKTRFDAGTLGAWTNAYASPEQIMDGAVPDPRDDIFALGLVTYELLTGRHPFDSKSAVEARFKELKPSPIRSLSGSQNKVLAAALHFKRDARLGSAGDLVRALGATASDTTGTAGRHVGASGVVSARTDVPSPARRRLQLSVTGGILLIWCGVVGGYWWSRQGVETAHQELPATAIERAVPVILPAATATNAPPVNTERVEVRPLKAPVIADRIRATQSSGAPVAAAADAAAIVQGGDGDVGSNPTDSWGRRGPHQATVAAEAALEVDVDNAVPAMDPEADAADRLERPEAKNEALYRWVDKDNRVRFGAKPPPEYAETAVKIVDTE